MRFSTILAFPMAIISAGVIPSMSIDPSLIPEFGLTAGQKSNGSSSCIGANNVLIPCFCPPNREKFIEKVNLAVALGNFLGKPVTFNVDPLAQSNKDQFDRATTSLIVLQSFNGTNGTGCPAASAPTILNQQLHFVKLLDQDTL